MNEWPHQWHLFPFVDCFQMFIDFYVVPDIVYIFKGSFFQQVLTYHRHSDSVRDGDDTERRRKHSSSPLRGSRFS